MTYDQERAVGLVSGTIHAPAAKARAFLVGIAGYGIFAAGCSEPPSAPLPGSLRVSVQTSGGDPDEDGYEVVIGSGVRRPIGSNAFHLLEVPAGTHLVRLDGVAPNCEVSGAHPIPATVSAGGTVEVPITVSCGATGIEITAITTGTDVPAGHHVVVNDQASRPIAANGSVVVSRLPPGVQAVTMRTTGGHCTVDGSDRVTVEVTSRALTPVRFQIVCVQVGRTENIAYVADRSIYMAKPDGSGAVKLVDGHSPSWSPDGNKLVFSTKRCDSWDYYCTGDLRIIDPETRVSTIVPNSADAYEPAWAPNDDRIAFTRFGRLFVMSLAASAQVEVPLPVGTGFGNSRLAWSPGGERIAFVCIFNSHPDLCVIKPDGTGFVRLTNDGVQEWDPAWSPDGQMIAFWNSATRPKQIMLIAADGSGRRYLTDGTDPAWSRDGTRIVFAGSGGLYTINVDGSNLRRLTTGEHFAPALRP